MHEAQLHDDNCFVTLTYADEHLPVGGNLDHRDYQLFMKRLREYIERNAEPRKVEADLSQNRREKDHTAKSEIRYFMCGEYGPTTGRPHYHAILFGINFNDKVAWKKTAAGSQLYKSELLDKLWKKGQCSIGNMTWQAAAYVARYNMKKAGQKNKKIEILNPDTGEICTRTPEYKKMSRRQGIGKQWIKANAKDVYPRGTIILNSMEAKPPRFYDNYYKTLDEAKYEELKSKRQHEQAKRPVDLTTSTLRQGEIVTRAKLAFLKRNGAN